MKTSKQIKRDAKALFRLCFDKGSLDEDLVRQVVSRVLSSKRRGSLALAAHFQRLVKLHRARNTAEVESATPLSADLQSRVQAGVDKMYGPGINTSFTHSPELIGGMRIKVGSDVYDGSIKAKLAALQKRF